MTSFLASVYASEDSLVEIIPANSFDFSAIFDLKENDLDYVDSLSYENKVLLFSLLIDQILLSVPQDNSNVFGLINFNHDEGMEDNMVINDILLHRINSITGLSRLRGGCVEKYNDLKVNNLYDTDSISFDWLGNIVEYCCVLENISAYISENLVDVEYDFDIISMCKFTLLNKITGKFHEFMLTLKPFNNRWIPTELRLYEISDSSY